MIRNQIVTRGLSPTTKTFFVTRGFIPGVIEEIAEISRRVAFRLGRSEKRNELNRVEEVVVFAKLIKVNDRKPNDSIKGWIRVTYDKQRRIAISAVKTAYAPIRSHIDRILIVIKRLKP